MIAADELRVMLCPGFEVAVRATIAQALTAFLGRRGFAAALGPEGRRDRRFLPGDCELFRDQLFRGGLEGPPATIT